MQPVPASGQTDEEIEEVFWESVECESARQVGAYLEVYPTGRYVAEAHACLEGQLGLERAERVLVQQGLTALDYEVGATDGLFGPATRKALRAWQVGKGFAGTGYLTREQADTLMAQGREAVARAEAERQRAAEKQRQQAQMEAERKRQEEEARRQAQEAERRQAAEADDAAYAEAQRADTAAGYTEYLRVYPAGRHAQEARVREAARREEMRQAERCGNGWLGVAIQTVTDDLAEMFDLDEPVGALVAEVTSGGPAEKAGIERGDIITHFKGRKVLQSSDLPAMITRTLGGEEVQIRVLRGGRQHTITVTLGERMERIGSREQNYTDWGMTVAEISDEHIQRYRLSDDQQGIVVTNVESSGPAELAGIRPGDVIEEVNRQAVCSIYDFTIALEEAEQAETLLLLGRRGNFTSFFALRKQG